MRHLITLLVGLFAVTAAHATDLYGYAGAGSIVPLENMIGRKLDGVMEFNDFTLSPDQAAQAVAYDAVIVPPGHKLALAIGLAFEKPSTDKAHFGAHTLADVGAGKLDDVYRAMGETLVAEGFAAADIRLGWEEDGDWYPWSAGQHEADWHAAFAHASAALRSVPGQHFTIWFNPGVAADPSKDLPAAGQYDGVGWDTYATSWAGSTVEPKLWSLSLHGWWGIGSEAMWPNATLPYAVPEFGVGSEPSGKGAPDAANKPNGGDDGVYMAGALNYFLEHHAKWIGYWDFNGGGYDSKISDGSRPHEALAFLQALGPPQVVALLKGATLSATSIAVPAGMHELVADLPAKAGRVMLFWGDTTVPRTINLVLPTTMGVAAVHPDGVHAWGRSAAIKGYVYAGGLGVLKLTP